jgi:hypothetical protein
MKVTIGKYPKRYTTERKISVQVDEFDTWSLDHTLALIIHPSLIKFKEDSMNTGHPCLKGVINCEGCTCQTEWLEMLDKMIWSFGEILNDEIHAYDLSTYKEYNERVQEGLELFGKYFRSLWT